MAVNPGPKFFTKPKNNKDSGVTLDFVNENIIHPLEVSIDKVSKLIALRPNAQATLAHEVMVEAKDQTKKILEQAAVPSVDKTSEIESETPGHSL